MPNPYMDTGPSAREVRERRRGTPPRAGRRAAGAAPAAAQSSADDKAAKLRATAEQRVTDGTVADVAKWVGKSAEKAAAALAAEQAGAARVSLIRKLEAVAG